MSTGKQGASAGEPAGGGSLVKPARRSGGGREDRSGLPVSDRRPGSHQLHQLCRWEAETDPFKTGAIFGAHFHMLIRSADYLASRCQASLDSLDHLNSSIKTFMDDNSGEKLNIKCPGQPQKQELWLISALFSASRVGTSASSYTEWPPGGRNHCPGQCHLSHGACGEI